MLSFAHQIRLMNGLVRLRQEPFRWSYTDCGAFVVRLIDAMRHTHYWENELKDNYSNEREALIYQTRIQTQRSFLMRIGYDQISTDNGIENGDIIMTKEKNFNCSHIVFDDELWSSGPSGVVKSGQFNIDSADVYRWKPIEYTKENN